MGIMIKLNKKIAMMLMEVGEVLRKEIRSLKDDFKEEGIRNQEFRRGAIKVLSLLAVDRKINNPILDELKTFLNE